MGSNVRVLPLAVEMLIANDPEKFESTWKTLLVPAAPPLNEYVNASPVLEAALMTTAAAVRAELY